MENKKGLSHFDLTGAILKCCFEVMKELGSGFVESVYKNALFIAMKEAGLNSETERPFEVMFRNRMIGRYSADLIVEKAIIIELKCCTYLLPEHQAQLINYLKVSNISIGLLVNFGNQKLEYRRLHHPENQTNKENSEKTFKVSSWTSLNPEHPVTCS